MKYSATFLTALLLLISGTVHAQCTPDPNNTSPGIFPTPVTGVAQGVVGDPYSQVLTLNVPQDTTIDLSVFFPGLPTATATVNFQTIDTINGLPPGLTFACNPTSCSIIGGNSGCIEISGTPTTTGQYVANVATTVNITVPASIPVIGGTPQDLPVPVAYNIEVTGTNNVDPGLNNGFKVEPISPNPAATRAKIDFYTSTISDVQVEVTSLSGQVIHRQLVRNASGETTVELNVQDYAPGMYFYRLNDGQNKVTRRLVVAR